MLLRKIGIVLVVEEEDGWERRWISEMLGMRDLSRVTNAVSKVDVGKESEIRRWKIQLGAIS